MVTLWFSESDFRIPMILLNIVSSLYRSLRRGLVDQ